MVSIKSLPRAMACVRHGRGGCDAVLIDMCAFVAILHRRRWPYKFAFFMHMRCDRSRGLPFCVQQQHWSDPQWAVYKKYPPLVMCPQSRLLALTDPTTRQSIRAPKKNKDHKRTANSE
nr:hypothetical protein [Pandoravirus massiliensis]